MDIDLHVHSNNSDGHFSPEELFVLAEKNNIKYLAITDHDILNDWNALAPKASAHGITLIDGIELSASIPGAEVHILGYNLNRTPELINKLNQLKELRVKRFYAITEKLASLGINLNADQILASARGTTGRAMAARALVEKGYCNSTKEAFEKYLKRGGSAYIANDNLPVSQAVKLIKQSGGVACLAHPYRTELSEMSIVSLIKSLKDYGLDAVETIYPSHSPSEINFLRKQCDKHRLVSSIGSDFHGNNSNNTLKNSVIRNGNRSNSRLGNNYGKNFGLGRINHISLTQNERNKLLRLILTQNNQEDSNG